MGYNERVKAYYVFIPFAVLLTALLGSWFTGQGIPDWYQTLRLPNIAPSGGFIGTAWTILFILMAVAGILIWKNASKIKNFYWVVWLAATNLILNALWSYLFFVQHLLGWAVVEVIILNLTTLLVIAMVWRRQRLAAWLLVSYFLWVNFATYLAYQIWLLN